MCLKVGWVVWSYKAETKVTVSTWYLKIEECLSVSNYNHTTRERRKSGCDVPFEFANWAATRSKWPRTTIKHLDDDALNQTTTEWSHRKPVCVVSEALRFRAGRKDCVEGISDLLVFVILHKIVGVGLFILSDFFMKEAMEEGECGPTTCSSRCCRRGMSS